MKLPWKQSYNTSPTTPEERAAAAKAYGDERREASKPKPSTAFRSSESDHTQRDEFEEGWQRLLGESNAVHNTGTSRRSSSQRPISFYYGTERQSGVNIPTGLAYGLGLIAVALVGAGSAKIVDSNYGSDRAARYLEQQGYTNVVHTDTDYFLIFGCGKGDTVKYDMEATAQNGDRVNAIVCKGLFKGATFRDGGLVTPDAPVSPVSPRDYSSHLSSQLGARVLSFPTA
jgi:hypothetical protein